MEMLQSAYHLPEDLSLGLGVEVVDEDVLAVHQLHLERLEVVYPGCGDAVELADVLIPGPLALGELDALLVDSPLDEPVPLYLDLVERPALAAFDPGDELLESVLLAVSDVERIQLYAGVGEPADELALFGDVLERLLVVEHEDSRDSALGAGLLYELAVLHGPAALELLGEADEVAVAVGDFQMGVEDEVAPDEHEPLPFRNVGKRALDSRTCALLASGIHQDAVLLGEHIQVFPQNVHLVVSDYLELAAVELVEQMEYHRFVVDRDDRLGLVSGIPFETGSHPARLDDHIFERTHVVP